MDEEYQLGYNDYINSSLSGRETLLEQSHLRSDMYWSGVKAAYHFIEMESLKC